MNYDLTNILLYLAIIIIPLIAQFIISSSYSKYKRTSNSTGLTGVEVARRILDANALNDIYVVETSGDLTDHYDPTRKVVRLSSDIFHGKSVASTAVAAHECGHAIQDHVGYKPMKLRSLIVPVVNLASKAAWVVIILGLITQYFKIFVVGIGLISFSLVFQLITLPVEFDASSRAKKEIIKLGLATNSDSDGVAKMLFAAAMTYVAGVLSSVLEILRLVLMFRRRN